MNNQPVENLHHALQGFLDIDRTLWFLVQEMIFSDDDSYIYKGGMDYYVYWDISTERLMPLEVDGNSVMLSDHVNWSPFYNEDDNRFPLLYRMLQNDEIRQRYLAHLRTVLDEYFVEDKILERIDEFAAKLDQRVQNDPKKIYSYNNFVSGVSSLKNLVINRINFLSDNNEIKRESIELSNVKMVSSNGENVAPSDGQSASIQVSLSETAQQVLLYYGSGIDGVFERIEMFDDGLNQDGEAGDLIYGGEIPGFGTGEYIRYYVEARKEDAFQTSSFIPAGAEHDVFIYQVDQPAVFPSDIVINELMADNESNEQDASSEFEDWIELYNKGDENIDISGYYLTDDGTNLTKWAFPENTILAANSYLIVWTDDDEDQTTTNELHANFKLSKAGENLILSNNLGEVIELIQFGEQITDVAYARIPNGVGDFVYQESTFGFNNESTTAIPVINEDRLHFSFYPNPANDQIMIQMDYSHVQDIEIQIFSMQGRLQFKEVLNSETQTWNLDISMFAPAYYVLSVKDMVSGNRMNQKLVVVR